MMKRSEMQFQLKEYVDKIRKEAIPHVVSASVVFTYEDETLKILLLEFETLKGILKLPERPIFNNEEIGESAELFLTEALGLTQFYLAQFHTFDTQANQMQLNMETEKHFSDSENYKLIQEILTQDDMNYFLQRLIVIGHYAFLNKDHKECVTQFPISSSKWYDYNTLDSLPINNSLKQIIQEAHQSLKQGILFSPALKYLLPLEFTIAELQKLIEVLVGKELDRPNFRKKVLSSGSLTQVGKKTCCNHRAPFTYRLVEDYYKRGMER